MRPRQYEALYTALQQGYPQQVAHLITDKGISVNHQFGDGCFPLHISAEKQNVVIVKNLLSLRASPDLKNSHGETALLVCIKHMTSAERGVQIVNALISKGANVNSYDSQKRTALHLAASKGRAAVVMTLLSAGARVDSQDSWARTPLHMAFLSMPHDTAPSANIMEVFKILISWKCDVNKRDKHQHTPLYLAVNHGDAGLPLAQMLLSNGALPDRISRHKLVPVMLAAMKGYYAMVKLLLSYNCDVTIALTNTGKSCLFTAVNGGHLEIARLLIAAGLNPYADAWHRDPSTVERLSTKFPHMTEWLRELTTAPLSLKVQCRSCIRRSLKHHNLNRVIESLCYPKVLKSYLLLEN